MEITTRYAKTYAKAAKSDKGRILDEVVSVTGWSRDNARRRLRGAAAARPGAGRQVAGRQVAKRPRRPRRPKFSYDARKVLQRVYGPGLLCALGSVVGRGVCGGGVDGSAIGRGRVNLRLEGVMGDSSSGSRVRM